MGIAKANVGGSGGEVEGVVEVEAVGEEEEGEREAGRGAYGAGGWVMRVRSEGRRGPGGRGRGRATGWGGEGAAAGERGRERESRFGFGRRACSGGGEDIAWESGRVNNGKVHAAAVIKERRASQRVAHGHTQPETKRPVAHRISFHAAYCTAHIRYPSCRFPMAITLTLPLLTTDSHY